ncbi:MAG: hypothetical protein Q9178_001048 [Gyalolechia marmorata]
MEEQGSIRHDHLTDTPVKVRDIPRSTNETSENCVVCLQPITEQALCKPCRHANFDFLCLISWLQERSTCPLCNHLLTLALAQELTFLQNLQSSSRRKPEELHHTERQRLIEYSSPDAALLRRRQVYARKLYSSHVGTNRLSRYQDLSPQLFSRDEELLRRARKWIRRELQVFDFLNVDGQEEEGIIRRTNNAEFLLEYIVAILKTVDVKGSGGQAEEMLQEFLGRENTQLFLHELKAWLRSPYTSLEDWDRHVQYAGSHAQGLELPKCSRRGLRQDASNQLRSASDSAQSFPTHSNGVERRIHDRYTPYQARVRPWRGHVQE